MNKVERSSAQRSETMSQFRSGGLAAVFLTFLLLLLPGILPGEVRLVAQNVSVGNKLQNSSTIALLEAAPVEGLDITIRSTNKSKLLLSKSPLQQGSETVVLHVNKGFQESPEFWLQGLAGEGEIGYKASAPGYADGDGTVTLTPSAIAVSGPYRAPEFTTIAGAPATKITLSAARLDASFKFIEEQLILTTGALPLSVVSSKKDVGAIIPSSIALTAGSSSVSVTFQPLSEGETELTVVQPPGFSPPAQFASIKAIVKFPGLALSDHLTIGNNLQVAGVLSLGAPAPEKGVSVTLISEDPKRLLLSPAADKPGVASLTVNLKAGEAGTRYYLQSMADSGSVKYTATAPGYRTRTAEIALSPSGVVLTPASQGPPDEAQVLRKDPSDGTHSFASDLSSKAKTPLVAWTVQLDPVTHRSADITVQPLRAGMSLTIPLTNSEPRVGTVLSSIKILGGTEHSVADFLPLSEGSTTISVTTPEGFTKSANSTSVIAVVR